MKQLFILFSICLLVISCTRNPDRKHADTAEERAYALERENFLSSLQDPDEVANSLIQGITAFDSAMLNDPEGFYHYNANSIKAAANMGIYLADLNYCILYKKHEHTKKYFQVTYELSKTIQIDNHMLEFIRQRYQRSLERQDSLIIVFNQLFTQSTSELIGTDKERLAGIAMIGYQVENLHLVLATFESFPENPSPEQILTQQKLLQYILEQRGKFEVVYNFVRANADPLNPGQNPNYPFFDNALRELIRVYQKVTDNDPLISELREKVEAIRYKIVER